MLKNILQELGLSEVAIRVYTRLLEVGEAPARNLAENTGLPRATVYDALGSLLEAGLITEQNETSHKVFKPSDPENIARQLVTKIENLKQRKTEFIALLPKLKEKTDSSEPRITHFPGEKGVKQVLTDLLWHENIEALTLWPFSEMVKVLGNDYLEEFNRRRIRRGISLKAIWPRDKAVEFKDHPFFGVGPEHLRELRLAPAGITWNMGHAVYGDTTAFISSSKESFGMIIRSRDFTQMQRVQFDVLWQMSEPVKIKKQFDSDFLRTI